MLASCSRSSMATRLRLRWSEVSPWTAFFLGVLVGVIAACGLFLLLSRWLDNREREHE